jgi:L-seryl-tRNA(Ser) seleniumtransferase
MVDQAAGIPPYSNFLRYAKLGVDLFCFSGGKGLMGPQVSGILCGRKDLIVSALYNCAPWEGSICRPMKVGKEEIMGCIAALDYWSKADCDAINKEWQRRLERLAKMVETVPGVQTEIKTPAAFESDAFPTLHVHWDAQKFGLTVAQCNHLLKSGNPRIEVQTNENISGVLARIKTPDAPLGLGRPTSDEMRILPITMQPGEELIVGNALTKILAKARKQATG